MTNDRPEIFFMGSREVRTIPKGWQHPKDAHGRFVPLLPAGYWSDEPVDPAALMPTTTWDTHTEIAAYETTTEGTPISPAFPSTPAGRRDLVAWCADHETTFGRSTASIEAWAAILFGDAAIALDGTVVGQG